MPAVEDAPNDIASLRSRIDTIDAEIARLVSERCSCSHAVQAIRLRGGGPRTELARERLIIERYAAELGPAGIPLANVLLTTCRGPFSSSATAASGGRVR